MEIQKAAGIYWPEALREPEKMAKLAMASHRITGLECVRVPYDFAIMPEALGCRIKYYDRPDLKPAIIEHPFKKPEDLKMPEDFLERGRIPAVLEALHIVRGELGDFLPVSSFAFSPFSLASELAGPMEFYRWVNSEPDYVREFVGFAADVSATYANALYRAGADVVTVGEPTGTPDNIGPKVFDEFIKPALIKMSKKMGGIRIFHPCGDVMPFLSHLVDIGFDGLGVYQSVDIAQAKSILGGRMKILGNIQSRGVLTHGTPEEVKAVARKALEKGVDVLEPSCGIEPTVPIANIKAFVEEVKEFEREMREEKNSGNNVKA